VLKPVKPLRGAFGWLRKAGYRDAVGRNAPTRVVHFPAGLRRGRLVQRDFPIWIINGMARWWCRQEERFPFAHSCRRSTYVPAQPRCLAVKPDAIGARTRTSARVGTRVALGE